MYPLVIGSVKSKSTFDALRSGVRVNSGPIRMIVAELTTQTGSPGQTVELGVAFGLTKRFGNAVTRNRGRRRLRHAFNQAAKRFFATSNAHPGKYAVMVTARPSVVDEEFTRLVYHLEQCLAQLNDRFNLRNDSSKPVNDRSNP